MSVTLSIIGIIASLALIKYRERVGDMIGDAYWMRHVGGVYNFLIIFAIFVFFWCIATLTGTSNFFFTPLRWILPGMNNVPTVEEF